MTEKIIIADRDTYTDQANPDTNYGSSNQLGLEFRSDFYDQRYRQPFIHFPLTAIPTGASINSALLYLHVEITQNYAQNKIYVPIADWEEYTLTWNNKPDSGWSSDDFISCASAGWVSVDIKDFIVSWLTNKNPEYPDYQFPNYGLHLEPEYPEWPNSAYFSSREKRGYEPCVVVDYSYSKYLGNSYIID